MRRLTLLCFALLGALTATLDARAGNPGAGVGGHAHQYPGPNGAPAVSPTGHAARCMCPDCQVARVIRDAGDATVIIEGPDPSMVAGSVTMPAGAPCAACEATAGTPMMLGEAPGHARLGGPALASGEPTPIGVVQANYAQTAPVDPAIAAFHRSAQSMPMAPGMPPAGMPPSNPWLPTATGRRPSLLGNFFGTSHLFSRNRAAREARRAEAHAAIPMGMAGAQGRVSELPASMVYGR